MSAGAVKMTAFQSYAAETAATNKALSNSMGATGEGSLPGSVARSLAPQMEMRTPRPSMGAPRPSLYAPPSTFANVADMGVRSYPPRQLARSALLLAPALKESFELFR